MRTSVELIFASSARPETTVDELEVVRLTEPVLDRNGRRIEAGTRGTVVAIYPDGVNCEVEFTSPFQALATVDIATLSSS